MWYFRGRMLLAFLFLASTPWLRAEFRHFEDASLRAVHFIDTQEGWAVGDDGVVLHTIDAGQSWERQPTGVRASLRSVQFLDPIRGWAAGRIETPTGGSVGVLLSTTDGGLKWTQVAANAMPGLNVVKFTDAKTGFALGDGVEPFTSGIFRTLDGGRTWDVVPGQHAPSWRAGDFQDGGNGLLGGAWSRLGTLQQGKMHVAEDLERMSGRAIHALQIFDQRAVAVGDGGLVLRSQSGGVSWGFADLKLPDAVRASLDFRALQVVGKSIWIAGRPGSVIVHSGDAGQTWSLHKTGQSLPLHGLSFPDANTGWAVGDAGTILHSADAGKTWTRQRGAGKRASVLAINARASDTPIDTVVRLGGLEGQLVTTLQVCQADPSHAAFAKATEGCRLASAVRQAGGLTAESLWTFPCPQYFRDSDRSALLAFWNQRHANQAERELVRQLVLALRTWRPSVVLGDDTDSKDPARSLVAEALLEAVKNAADPKMFPDQIEHLGLEAWKTARVFVGSDSATAHVTQDNGETRIALHGSVRDYATDLQRLLVGDQAHLPARRFYQLAQSADAVPTGKLHWMQGIVVAEGEGRRAVPLESKDDPETLKSLRMVRHFTGFAEKMEDPHRMFEQLTPILTNLPEEQAAASLYALGQSYVRKGQWFLAQEAYLLMIDRYPAHASTLAAYRWLVHFNSSVEARRRFELRQFAAPSDFHMEAEFISVVPKDKKGVRQAAAKNETVNAVGVQQASASKKVDQTARKDALAELRAWHKGAQTLSRRLPSFGALHATEPTLQFSLQAGKRNLGEAFVNPEFFTRFREFVGSGPWADAAQGELWLNNRSLPLPRPVGKTRLAETRPHLDGVFDDACWRDLKPMVLKNVAGATTEDHPTEAMFAYDQEFLYLAIRCQHPRGNPVAKATTRPRDAVLEGNDRISLLLDLDRDYTSYFRLEVDRRGMVREDCGGDTQWNPRWFVAVLDNEDCWRVEAAIPLGELTGEPINLNSVWAFNLVRTLPGQGVQSFSQPADVEPRPEGMTLLMFVQDAQRAKAAPMPTAP